MRILQHIHLLLIFITLNFYTVTAIAAVTITDDLGHQLVFENPPQRVITLAPHLSEMVSYLGYERFIVGRDHSSNYPSSIKDVPDIGDAFSLNLEAILKQKPDLILVWYSGIKAEQAAQLSENNIPLFYSEPGSLAEILDNLRKLEVIFGPSQQSQKAIKSFELNISAIHQNNTNPVKVFYQTWNKPLSTLNGKHFVTEIIELCGGENIFSELTLLSPQISLEAVIQKKPEIIVSGQSFETQKQFWGQWKTIPAVTNDSYIYIKPDLLVRPGPRIIQGKEQLCKAISDFKNKN